MKPVKIILIAATAIIIAACSSSKKSTTSTASTAPASIASPAPSSYNMVSAKPANGIYAPGNEELAAIQTQYKDVTLDKLKEGHLLYTEGACINCHKAQSIYEYDEAQWLRIIENMARKARITDLQKDAVYKYVLAIKATQPREHR